MEPIEDGHGEWTCTNCGQFFLDKTWSYCPICGSQIEWSSHTLPNLEKELKSECLHIKCRKAYLL